MKTNREMRALRIAAESWLVATGRDLSPESTLRAMEMMAARWSEDPSFGSYLARYDSAFTYSQLGAPPQTPTNN